LNQKWLDIWKVVDPYLLDNEGFAIFCEIMSLSEKFKEMIRQVNYKELYREWQAVRCRFCGFPAGSYGFHEGKIECLYCGTERAILNREPNLWPLPTHAPEEILELANVRHQLTILRCSLTQKLRDRLGYLPKEFVSALFPHLVEG